MNTLIIGTELPDYNHPVLFKYTDIEKVKKEPNLDQQLIEHVQSLPVYNFIVPREKLHLYYMEKFRALVGLYSAYMSEYALIRSQCPSLAAELILYRPSNLKNMVPFLEELKIYHSELNQHLDFNKKIHVIRLGLAFPDLVSYNLIFEKLGDFFCANEYKNQYKIFGQSGAVN